MTDYPLQIFIPKPDIALMDQLFDFADKGITIDTKLFRVSGCLRFNLNLSRFDLNRN